MQQSISQRPPGDLKLGPLWNASFVAQVCGSQTYEFVQRIFPICRSITGDGVRQTLAASREFAEFTVHEIESGTPVFDWTVPLEWNIADAYVRDATGKRVIDFKASNLHVVSYSEPVDLQLSLDELKPHIHSLPEQPELIPYRTSYYARQWGFCMAHRDLEALKPGMYDVRIDSRLEPGALTYGEFVHRGESDEEVLLSAHVCHPSLANDNCSGVAVLVWLARWISQRRTRLTYRFVLAPGTIGAITWLARNEAHVGRIKAGLVVAGIGDAGAPTYKRSRRGNSPIDRAMAHVLEHEPASATSQPQVIDFSPYGYDERQYGSPGFDLPVGLLQRTPFGTFPQYHTSADNLDFVAPAQLASSVRLIMSALDILEQDCYPLSTNQKCEPQLGRRGLYRSTGGDKDGPARSMAMLWVLNLADGEHSILDMAQRSNLPFARIHEAAQRLAENGLLKSADAV